MAVYTINAHVTAQDIAVDLGDVKLVSGSQNIYQVQFDYSDEWTGFTKKVVFETGYPKRSVIELLISGTNIVTIPERTLGYDSMLKIGIYGVAEDTRFPTVWSKQIPIYSGTKTGNPPPPAPDPEVYDEILAALATKQEAATAATKAMLNIKEVTEWKNGGYKTTVGETIDFDNPASASSKKCTFAPINEGEFVYFNVSAGSTSYRAYGFLDEDQKVIESAGNNSFTGNRVRTAPKGAKWVIINSNRTHTTSWVRIGSFEELIARWTGQFGNVAMFNSIAVIGTSFDAGYFYANGHAYEKRNKAWIKHLGNMYGITAHNFGVTSGTTCLPDSSWVGTDGAVSWQGNENGLPALQASSVNRTLYFMDLVQNDASKLGSAYLGTIADVKEDYTQNPDTFYGNYARIIELIKAKDSRAMFIFMYKAGDQVSTIENTFADAVVELANHFEVPSVNWLSDPWYNGWIFSHLVTNHPTSGDYATMAKCADRLFSEVMRTNWAYFKDYNPLDE